MRLADLKQGMVCELRNGYEIIILSNDKYVFDRHENFTYQLSKDFNDNLIGIDIVVAGLGYDIMKVSYGDKVLFEREEKVKWFEPKKNETYYTINVNDVIKYTNDSYIDDELFTTHQVFKTYEKAQAHLKYKQAELKIIKWIAQNDNVVLDWENISQDKWYVFNNGEYLDIECLVSNSSPKHFYLSSEELAQRLIDELGTELKIWLGVEE